MSTLVYTSPLGRPSLLLVPSFLPARAEPETYVETAIPGPLPHPLGFAPGSTEARARRLPVALPSRGPTQGRVTAGRASRGRGPSAAPRRRSAAPLADPPRDARSRPGGDRAPCAALLCARPPRAASGTERRDLLVEPALVVLALHPSYELERLWRDRFGRCGRRTQPGRPACGRHRVRVLANPEGHARPDAFHHECAQPVGALAGVGLQPERFVVDRRACWEAGPSRCPAERTRR